MRYAIYPISIFLIILIGGTLVFRYVKTKPECIDKTRCEESGGVYREGVCFKKKTIFKLEDALENTNVRH